MKPDGDRTRVEVWAARGVCLWLCAWVPWRTRSLSCFPRIIPACAVEGKSEIDAILGARQALGGPSCCGRVISDCDRRPRRTGPLAPTKVSPRSAPPWLGIEHPVQLLSPKGPPKAGTFDDTVFVAADYTTGHTTSVTEASAPQFLPDSGDPLPLQAGQINSLTDLSLKPERLAKLLAGDATTLPLRAGHRGARSKVQCVLETQSRSKFSLSIQSRNR